jgi:hypothetical protein
MGEEWEQNPQPGGDQPGPKGQPGPDSQPDPFPFNQEDIDKRIEDIKRVVILGAGEAQVRFKRVMDKANTYWQQAQTTPAPHQPSSIEEHRIRQLVNIWSNENWRVTRDLGNYMEIVSSSSDEIWEATLQTRWETRTMEVITEPYSGRSVGLPGPLLPVWDYALPAVVGLKPPQTHTRLEQMMRLWRARTAIAQGAYCAAPVPGADGLSAPTVKVVPGSAAQPVEVVAMLPIGDLLLARSLSSESRQIMPSIRLAARLPMSLITFVSRACLSPTR